MDAFLSVDHLSLSDADFRLDEIVVTPTMVILGLSRYSATAACPLCGVPLRSRSRTLSPLGG
jgi:hypothetical protein